MADLTYVLAITLKKGERLPSRTSDALDYSERYKLIGLGPYRFSEFVALAQPPSSLAPGFRARGKNTLKLGPESG